IRDPSPRCRRPPLPGHLPGGDLPLLPLGHHFTPFRGTLHPSPPLFNPQRSLFHPGTRKRAPKGAHISELASPAWCLTPFVDASWASGGEEGLPGWVDRARGGDDPQVGLGLTWWMRESQAGLREEAVLLAGVARPARRHHVLPRVRT